MKAAYRVDYIESERGWGQRIDFQRDFDNLEEATKAVAEFNAQNKETVVPDWYMYATTPYLVDLDVVKPPKQ